MHASRRGSDKNIINEAAQRERGELAKRRRRRHKKNASELEQELRILRRHGVGKNVTSIINNLMKYGFVALALYFAKGAIEALAGQTTLATIDISASAVASTSTEAAPGTLPLGTLSWIVLTPMVFGWLCLSYARRERNLRRDVVEQFNEYKVQAERQIDPRRTSSGLTLRGETRPEDA